jgi:hypothetical protein
MLRKSFLSFLQDPKWWLSHGEANFPVDVVFIMILSWVPGSVTNNNGFWIGWLDLLITSLQSLLITINYNQSVAEDSLHSPPPVSVLLKLLNWTERQSQSDIATDGQSVSKSRCRASVRGSWPGIYYCLTVTVLLLWGALSDDRTGLSFVYAADTCQRSLSRVRVPWYSVPGGLSVLTYPPFILSGRTE